MQPEIFNRWEVGGEVFFLKLYLAWRVDNGLSVQVLFGCRGGGFIFLSANGKAQGALLLFLLSLGGEKDIFSMCSSTCSAYKHLTFIPYALANVVLLSPVH